MIILINIIKPLLGKLGFRLSESEFTEF